MHSRLRLRFKLGRLSLPQTGLSNELPELPCEVPEELDIKILHCAEGVEIWGVRTPAGRIWLRGTRLFVRGATRGLCFA